MRVEDGAGHLEALDVGGVRSKVCRLSFLWLRTFAIVVRVPACPG
jgi:hypothetical protein